MRVAEEVLGVLSALEYPAVDQVRITEQLDRAMYAKVNKVLESIGGKWNRSKKVHLFGSDARVRVDHVIDTGEVTTAGDVGFFPTPVPLARKLVELADIRPGMTVLEPSAGTGRIVDALLAVDDVLVTCVERDAAMRKRLSQYNARVQCADVDDFMRFDIGRLDDGEMFGFERTVMNPPFGKVGEGDHLDHVRHAFDLMSADGILVAVLPSSIKFRRDRRYTAFRTWLTDLEADIEDLPPGTFKESGTGVNTVTVRVCK